MIFKYCVWPDVAKDEPNAKVLVNGTGHSTSELTLKPPTSQNSLEGLLGCCPCLFRSRRPIGIVSGNTSEAVVIENGSRTTIPVLAVKISDSCGIITKDESADQRTDRNTKRILSDSACITSEEIPSPYRYVDEVRSNSGSSSSSNRSARSGRRVQSRETLPVHTESDESNVSVDKNSRASSPSTRSNDKAFDVISTKSNPSRCSSPDAVSIHTDVVEELERTSLDSPTKLSLESLLEGCDEDGPTASDLATPTSSKSSNEQNSNIVDSGRSVMELNDGNDVNLERERLDSPDIETRVKNSSLRNTTEDTKNTAAKVLRSPVRLRTSYAYDRDLQDMDSNVTLPSTNTTVASPKYLSPRRFISEDRASKDTDSDETPPLPIGFDGVNQVESADSTDETDDVNVKQQSSRLQMPIDLPRRACKVSPCKTRSQKNSKRATSVSGNRPYEKHAEKTRTIQQCFEQLESNDWQVTLKGLSALVEIAKNEPEQLDICTPGLLARMLGKHVKNLRSQVARVACTAASQVFGAHIRGIEQDLDEIAGPLLHRTADTNKFLREDCNAALDSMVEHFPSHRTITTIINRGASHQNTIVHATTARLLFVTVNKIGPEHVMTLPRDVKDKLFATIAKLLTDGNLQARKHAKETFRLLSRCEGFRKTLTDSVPENTLRLIDKTLRSL